MHRQKIGDGPWVDVPATCDGPTALSHGRENLRVTLRNERRSVFDRYRPKKSAYSTVRCTVCGRSWRSKGKYVRTLPNADDYAQHLFIAWL